LTKRGIKHVFSKHPFSESCGNPGLPGKPYRQRHKGRGPA
jgi:hypothetical protein